MDDDHSHVVYRRSFDDSSLPWKQQDTLCSDEGTAMFSDEVISSNLNPCNDFYRSFDVFVFSWYNLALSSKPNVNGEKKCLVVVILKDILTSSSSSLSRKNCHSYFLSHCLKFTLRSENWKARIAGYLTHEPKSSNMSPKLIFWLCGNYNNEV